MNNEIDEPDSKVQYPIASSNPEWNDWKWQLKTSIKNVESLSQVVEGFQVNKELKDVESCFPLFITPYYFSLIQKFDYTDPIFQMSVPNPKEMINPPFLSNDPLHEEESTVAGSLVHRYKDRALLISTSRCAMYCRHCTRKRVTGDTEFFISDKQLEQSVAYLKSHPEIKDVVISGGDPFLIGTARLETIIKQVRSVPSVEIIRIGTRTPVTLPMRITDRLVGMLKKYHPIFVNTHFNHPVEVTENAVDACAKLINSGIPVNNQSVLLKGVNDVPEVMEELCRKLIRSRIRPYYLFQCDLVNGVEHFRTPIQKGIDIIKYLRGRLSGLAIPSFVVDAPTGKGKIPLLPNYAIEFHEEYTKFKNYQGEGVIYPEPIEKY